jgi:DNA excision repair protein ERCC-2
MDENACKARLGGENPASRPIIDLVGLLRGAQLRRSVHMSGTLAPLTEYRDSIGLPHGTATVTFPSPFPKQNRKVFYVEDVSTKYEEMQSSPEMVEVMEDHVVQVCNGVMRNTVVFFPSYALMDRFLDDGGPEGYPARCIWRRGGCPAGAYGRGDPLQEAGGERPSAVRGNGGRISEA